MKQYEFYGKTVNLTVGQQVCYQTKEQRKNNEKIRKGVITRIRVEIDGETIISPHDIKRCSL